jgi:transposase
MTSALPSVYLGLDVAKLTLACHLAGHHFSLANDATGHAELCRRLAAQIAQGAPVHVVCEHTGPYHRAVVRALRGAGFPVSVLQATRARQLAQGLGSLAKTDRLDAALLARLGTLLEPAPEPAPGPGQEKLAALVTRRDQLVELARREKQHLETTAEKALRRDIAQSLAQLEKRREKLEAQIEAHLATVPVLQERAARLRQMPGVGAVSAAALLAYLPELGQGARERLTSLAGLAPRACESGGFAGRRHVWGGRPKVRRILYLCALSASRHHPTLHAFYERLRQAGKAPKLALTALARKLLLHLHASLKNPNFSLA